MCQPAEQKLVIQEAIAQAGVRKLISQQDDEKSTDWKGTRW